MQHSLASTLFAECVSDMTDHALMIEIAEGQRDAWNELALRYQAVLAGFFLSKTRDSHRADDLTQATLMKAQRCAKSYVQNRERFDNGKVSAWLFRVARTVLIDDVRHQEFEPVAKAVKASAGADGEAWLANEVVARPAEDSAEHIRRHIDRLPAEQSAAFVAHFVNGESVESIARSLNLPEPTIYSRLRLARAKLQDMLCKDAALADTVSGWVDSRRPLQIA